MKFLDYLNESAYKTDIDEKTAMELLNSHCKNADFRYPILRGMRGKSDAYIFEGRNGDRKSLTGGLHNISIDHNLKNINRLYPLRSKCIIGISGTGNKSLSTARGFGSDLYAVFPYDDVLIGTCSEQDILATVFKRGMFDNGETVNDARGKLNDIVSTYNNFKSIDDAADHINGYVEENPGSDLDNIFDDPETTADILADIYSIKNLGLKFITNDEISKYDYKEMWVSDKCVAIKYDLYKKLLSEDFKIG